MKKSKSKIILSWFQLAVLCLVIMVGACREEDAYVLDRDTLTLVVRDMNMIELLIENKPDEIKDSLRIAHIHKMCSIYDVDLDDIEHDLEKISTDYLLLDTIYQNIILLDTISNSKTSHNDQ